MKLEKAFDPAALISALKAAGIADAEKLVNDELPVFFDWLNSSIAMEVGPYAPILTPILGILEQRATEEILKVV